MLELIAQVEPMSLPLWAVLAISAAMYPLGFMLGAPCSACCQGCPPCSYCDGAWIANEAEVCGFVSATVSAGTESATTSSEDVDTDWIKIAEFDCNGTSVYLKVKISPVDSQLPGFDECGCRKCYLNLLLSGFPDTTTDGPTVDCEFALVGETFAAYLDTCTETTLNATTTITGDVIEAAFADCQDWGSLGCSVPSFSDVEVSIEGVLQSATCECGACCPPEGECVNNVTQFYCEDATEGLGGTWQGVGTDCDPDPC